MSQAINLISRNSPKNVDKVAQQSSKKNNLLVLSSPIVKMATPRKKS